MELVDNVFPSGAQDVISLSVYNGATSFKSGKKIQSGSILPYSKLRPQSAPFKFADGTHFSMHILEIKKVLVEIKSLKNE